MGKRELTGFQMAVYFSGTLISKRENGSEFGEEVRCAEPRLFCWRRYRVIHCAVGRVRDGFDHRPWAVAFRERVSRVRICKVYSSGAVVQKNRVKIWASSSKIVLSDVGRQPTTQGCAVSCLLSD